MKVEEGRGRWELRDLGEEEEKVIEGNDETIMMMSMIMTALRTSFGICMKGLTKVTDTFLNTSHFIGKRIFVLLV